MIGNEPKLHFLETTEYSMHISLNGGANVHGWKETVEFNKPVLKVN